MYDMNYVHSKHLRMSGRPSLKKVKKKRADHKFI